MSYQRRHFSAIELAQMGSPSSSWPAVSIAFLCAFAVLAPPGLVSGMNFYLLVLVALPWLTTDRTLERTMLWVVLPFIAIIVAGLLGGTGADRYLYLKDAWYCSNPVAIIAVGYALGSLLGDTRRGLRAFVIGGTLAACVHLTWFAIHPDLLLRAATQIRSVAGTGYYPTALAVVVLLGCFGRWKERLGLPPALGAVCLVLCSMSVAFSFSRTMTLVVALGWLGVAGFFARREWLRISLLAVAMVAVIFALQASVDTTSAKSQRSFVGKLARSFDELQSSQRMTIREVNENWRGYETARAVDTWSSGNALQLVFGQGFGAQVDVGLFQKLTLNPREAVRFIPIFHNGYVYLLVKTGLFGVVMFLLAMGTLYLLGRKAAHPAATADARLEGRLLQTCVVVLLLTTWVISGTFNKVDMFAFLLLAGFLLEARLRSTKGAPAVRAWTDRTMPAASLPRRAPTL